MVKAVQRRKSGEAHIFNIVNAPKITPNSVSVLNNSNILAFLIYGWLTG
jgi:uncharacterized Fe-S cluster protein YjdI